MPLCLHLPAPNPQPGRAGQESNILPDDKTPPRPRRTPQALSAKQALHGKSLLQSSEEPGILAVEVWQSDLHGVRHPPLHFMPLTQTARASAR